MYKEGDSHGEIRIETVSVKLSLQLELQKATYIVRDLCYEQSLGALIFFCCCLCLRWLQRPILAATSSGLDNSV